MIKHSILGLLFIVFCSGQQCDPATIDNIFAHIDQLIKNNCINSNKFLCGSNNSEDNQDVEQNDDQEIEHNDDSELHRNSR